VKNILGRQNIRRHPFAHLVLLDIHQQDIALKATGKETRERIYGKAPNDLAELVLVTVTHHEEMVGPRRLALYQKSVPGEDQAAGQGCPGHQFSVPDQREVFNVTPHDPHPAGQFT
jgi:hypothetical protein